MRYVDFKHAIIEELLRNPEGLTWMELRKRLDLPYDRPCQSWIQRMEQEDGLTRISGPGRAYLWTVRGDHPKA
jgi:hypothetical protein